MDRFVLISGCSGGGKSTLLAEIRRRGHAVVEEPGRRIVKEELQGEGSALPWTDEIAFARRAVASALADRASAGALDGLVAVNSSAKADVTKTREDRIRDGARPDTKSEYVAEHLVIRTHPETGRKALYVSGGHTVRFKDMTEAESAPLLQYLFTHQQRPEFTCRFRWEVGSIAF